MRRDACRRSGHEARRGAHISNLMHFVTCDSVNAVLLREFAVLSISRFYEIASCRKIRKINRKEKHPLNKPITNRKSSKGRWEHEPSVVKGSKQTGECDVADAKADLEARIDECLQTGSQDCPWTVIWKARGSEKAPFFILAPRSRDVHPFGLAQSEA